jgi:PAS domain S-box-containing protein
VISYINHEVDFYLDQSPSLRLNNADTCRKESALQSKIERIADISRYNIVIHEVATVAFTRYISSKFYKAWRAHESGSVQSIRGQMIDAMTDFPPPLKSDDYNRRDIRLAGTGAVERCVDDGLLISGISESKFQAENSECGLSMCSVSEDRWLPCEKATNSTTFSRTTSEPSGALTQTVLLHSDDELATPKKYEIRRIKQPSIPYLPFSSFAEAAFAVKSENPRDDDLLLGSTWLATLIAGIESVSIGFSMLSAAELHPTQGQRVVSASVADSNEDRVDDFKFVYVNHQFERDFGYSKHELVGDDLAILFCTAHQEVTDVTLSKSETNFMNILRSGVNGNMGLTFRRKNGKLTHTFVCTKALYNQHGQLRYVMCLSVNIPVNCHIISADGLVVGDSTVNNSSGAVPVDAVHLISQFNSSTLIKLLDLLPAQFMDDYLPINGTVN